MIDLDQHNQAMIHRRIEAEREECFKQFGRSPLIDSPHWPGETDYYGVYEIAYKAFNLIEVNPDVTKNLNYYSRPKVLSLNWEPSIPPWE